MSVRFPSEGNTIVWPMYWEPISERGWCLQEFCMSPRALIFTSTTIQFKCPNGTRNIGNAIVREPEPEKVATRLPDILFHTHGPPPIVHDHDHWRLLHIMWWDVVRDYTKPTVSLPSDKLVASGALAGAFHCVLRSDYMAGLWRDTLLQDLLWRSREVLCARPAVYRAPSWSWPAVERTHIMGPGVENVWSWPSANWLPVAEEVHCEVQQRSRASIWGSDERASCPACGTDT